MLPAWKSSKIPRQIRLLRKPQPSWSLVRHPTRGWLTCSPMTRRDFVKPAFSLRKKRSVKTHALSLLGTTRLLSRSAREVLIGFYYEDILKIIGLGGLLARNHPTVLMLSAKAFAQMGLPRYSGAADKSSYAARQESSSPQKR